MQLSELVARDARSYVELVVRLCEDDVYRSQIVKAIVQNRAVLWRDLAPVRALENFLCEVALPNGSLSN
jgi:protein O-GlcNAc transferase